MSRVCAHLVSSSQLTLFFLFKFIIAILGVPSQQFEKFILEPMQSLGVFVIVIDALDECDNRASILQILSTQELPENSQKICTLLLPPAPTISGRKTTLLGRVIPPPLVITHVVSRSPCMYQ
jgi:hypothetical protein